MGDFFPILGLCVVLVGVCYLASLPGAIARKKNHKQQKPIQILGWVGLLFFPALIAAFIWCYIE